MDGYTRRAGAPAPAAVAAPARPAGGAGLQRAEADAAVQKLRAEHEQRRTAARTRSAPSSRRERGCAPPTQYCAPPPTSWASCATRGCGWKAAGGRRRGAGSGGAGADRGGRPAGRTRRRTRRAARRCRRGEGAGWRPRRSRPQRGTQTDARARRDLLLRDAAGRARRLQAVEAELASWTSGWPIRAARSPRAASAAARRKRRWPSWRRCRRCWRSSAVPCSTGCRRPRRRAALLPTPPRRARRRWPRRTAACARPSGRWGEAREQRVRAEAERSQAEQATASVQEAIAERLEVEPRVLPEIIDAPLKADLDVAAEERRLERLRREREGMGPVNLRADAEEAELRTQIDELQQQRGDLLEAVAKLRRGTAELDREGRERLRIAFAEIDRHFQALFTRLFGGGHAHLALTDAEDPLQAGLEVMASPPGKKLQLMSLLSGGEQTLTALALRFALFLGRPAPVCVLDEVDAALDDANVDRFCTLLADLAGRGTRFLVITHHRLTMARMHRLFGVTMVERGVSRLVSVDLHQPEPFRRTA
ncbi:MAG: hypothetical protein U1E38_08605 [Rhodospirillales bacterium]